MNTGKKHDEGKENTKKYWRKKKKKEIHRVLVTVEGPDRGREFVILPCRMQIGRRTDNYIRLSDPNVSRKHAALEFNPEKEQYVLTDLHSTNGTYLNEEKIDGSKVLTPGDRIRVGSSVLEVVDSRKGPALGRLGG